MSADPALFVFGHLATPEHLAEQARGRFAGLFHGSRIEPRDPGPAVPVIVLVEAGASAGVTSISVRYASDGSHPTRSSPEVEARLVATRWDDLAWQYVDSWQATIPAQPVGTNVRYEVLGTTSISGALLYADADRKETSRTLFGYNVDELASPSWIRDAVIYQIFVDRFFSPGADFTRPLADAQEIYGGDLTGITERLDYLKYLGINTLWITPIFEAETYHGYDAVDFRRIADRIGGPEALRDLVREAHHRNVRVLLDLALNHVSHHNPLFLEAQQKRDSRYHDWFTFTDWPSSYRSFFGTKTMPELNTANPEVVDYLCETATSYLTDFGVDGFRLDFALGPSMLFWTQFRSAAKTATPDSYTVGEVTLGPGGLQQFEGRLDGCLDFPMLQVYRQFFVNRTIDAAAFHSFISHQDCFFAPDFSRPTFLDNHDMNRFLWSAHGDVRKLKLAAAFQFTLAQPPIIYYGTEVGMSQESDVRDSGFEACRLPMIWDERQDLELLEYYRTLIATRHAHPALRLGFTNLIQASAGVYAYIREYGNDRVAVILNNTDAAQELDLPEVKGIDVVSGSEVRGSLKLPPLTAALVPA